MKSNKLVLVRHGQSIWNEKYLFTGWRDVPLTSQGVNEARNAGRLIRKNNIKIDNIFSSNLKTFGSGLSIPTSSEVTKASKVSSS